MIKVMILAVFLIGAFVARSEATHVCNAEHLGKLCNDDRLQKKFDSMSTECKAAVQPLSEARKAACTKYNTDKNVETACSAMDGIKNKFGALREQSKYSSCF